MKLYCVKGEILDPDDEYEYIEKILEFFGTQTDLKKGFKRLSERMDTRDLTMEPIEVPIDKKGLLEWLNTYAYPGVTPEFPLIPPLPPGLY